MPEQFGLYFTLLFLPVLVSSRPNPTPSVSTGGVVFWRRKRRRASGCACRRARVASSARCAVAAAAVVGKCVSSSSRSLAVPASIEVELVALISGFGGGASRAQ